MSIQVAIASASGTEIDQPFGKTNQFFVYELSGDQFEFKETKIVACDESKNNKENLIKIAKLLDECEFVLASKFGPGAITLLEERGIWTVTVEGPIDQALDWVRWTHRKPRSSRPKRTRSIR